MVSDTFRVKSRGFQWFRTLLESNLEVSNGFGHFGTRVPLWVPGPTLGPGSRVPLWVPGPILDPGSHFRSRVTGPTLGPGSHFGFRVPLSKYQNELKLCTQKG